MNSKRGRERELLEHKRTEPNVAIENTHVDEFDRNSNNNVNRKKKKERTNTVALRDPKRSGESKSKQEA